MSTCGFQLAQLIISKVFDSYIRDLGINLHLYKKNLLVSWYDDKIRHYKLKFKKKKKKKAKMSTKKIV